MPSGRSSKGRGWRWRCSALTFRASRFARNGPGCICRRHRREREDPTSRKTRTPYRRHPRGKQSSNVAERPRFLSASFRRKRATGVAEGASRFIGVSPSKRASNVAERGLALHRRHPRKRASNVAEGASLFIGVTCESERLTSRKGPRPLSASSPRKRASNVAEGASPFIGVIPAKAGIQRRRKLTVPTRCPACRRVLPPSEGRSRSSRTSERALPCPARATRPTDDRSRSRARPTNA